MVKLQIPDRKLFVSGVLQPIGKLNDSCVVSLNDSTISSIVCTADAAVILHTTFKLELDLDSPINLNIPDIKKLIKVLDCINSDSLVLEIDKNNISYNDNSVKFKYHLLEDNIISVPKINIKKIEELSFPVKFTIEYKTLLELLRGSTFATESNKLYLYSENSKVFGDLTDRARHNVDSFSLPLADYAGPELPPLCLNFELIRIISGVRVKQLQCSINPKLGVIVFESNSGPVTTRYIASSLVK